MINYHTELLVIYKIQGIDHSCKGQKVLKQTAGKRIKYTIKHNVCVHLFKWSQENTGLCDTATDQKQ
jgi:hypothetical protein